MSHIPLPERASVTIRAAASATSPSRAASITRASGAALHIARTDNALEPTMRTSAGGVALAWSSRLSAARTDTGMSAHSPASRTICRASAMSEIAPAVGPEATALGSSPTTSESTKLVICAGNAARKSPPPLVRLSAWRTMFMRTISRPAPNKLAFTAAFCASVTPATGATHNAEPPPEISASTWAFGPCSRAMAASHSSAASPAAAERSDGTG